MKLSSAWSRIISEKNSSFNFFFYRKMIRRNIRLRKEYLYKKSLEGKQKEEYEKKERIRKAIEGIFLYECLLFYNSYRRKRTSYWIERWGWGVEAHYWFGRQAVQECQSILFISFQVMFFRLIWMMSTLLLESRTPRSV